MSTTKFTKEIAQLIESQFPAVYQEDGEAFVAFITAYYEFLESDPKYSHKLGRDIFDIADIDTTLEDFLVHFKDTYLSSFPYLLSTDTRFIVKHIVDYYKSKGSKQSLELLMKLLFNEQVSIYNPGDDVLRLSDSQWFKPLYIEVSQSPRNNTFLNKQISGIKSGAKAFVESIVQKRVQGKFIDVLYLSNVRGAFITGERVTDDGVIKDAPKIKGSLSDIEIITGGRNNAIGDIFKVITPEGVQGTVKVTGVRDATGRVDFSIVNGGWGFSTDSTTKVYVSDAIVFVDNPDQSFIEFEPVSQFIENIDIISGANVLSGAQPGNYIIGKNGSNVVANGTIITASNTAIVGGNTSIVQVPSANGTIKVHMNSGSFGNQLLLQTSVATGFALGEFITEESRDILTISNVTGTFSVGETVKQFKRESVSNNIIGYAYGTVLSANSTVLTLDPAWGTFITGVGAPLITGATSGATALVLNFTIDPAYYGARGKVIAVSANTVTVDVVYGLFDIGNQIRGDSTYLVANVTGSSQTGATAIYLNNVNTSNAVITSSATAYVDGIIIGQNTSAVGIYGNTSPFFFSNTYSTSIQTNRENMVSPPRYANNTIINVTAPINRIAGGSQATFGIGVIEDVEQNVTVYSDVIGANNIVGVPYYTMNINGTGSGIGYVQSITVNTGGTGYANNARVSFTSGGFANGEPLVPADAFITTDGSGVITTITVDVNGAGYYDVPTLTLPSTSGTVANVTPVMDYGYGFPKSPNSDQTNLIGDALSVDTIDVGSIALLSNVNPGQAYTADPFILVRNQSIEAYGRRDIAIGVINATGGSMAIGERVVQNILGTTSVKGRVKSTSLVGGAGEIYIERINVGVSFNNEYPIVGETTGAAATIVDVRSDETSDLIGNNANITAKAGAASGVATSVGIITSGFGYVDGDDVTMISDTNPFVIGAISKATTQGISAGYWRSTTSHLNSEKKIHDNKYYQEYSYDIFSGLSLDKYEAILNKVFHVAGTKMFGSVVKTSSIDSRIGVAACSIEKLRIANNYIVTETGANLITKSGSYIVIRTEVEV